MFFISPHGAVRQFSGRVYTGQLVEKAQSGNMSARVPNWGISLDSLSSYTQAIIAITQYLPFLQSCTLSHQIMLVAISEPSPVTKAETSFCHLPPPRKRRESRRVQCAETSP